MKAVRAGISELRISYGPGYRVYFMQRGATVVILLCGGEKSTQQDDIAKAKKIAEIWKEYTMPSKIVRELLKKHPGSRVWDAADCLDSPEAIAAYMDATMEEANGDQAVIMKGLNTVARAQKRNTTELAKETGITRSGLYEALSPEGNPSFATVQKLVAALGLRLTFKPAP